MINIVIIENEKKYSREKFLNASYDFDIDVVEKHCVNKEDPNREAWLYLHSAMCTPEFFPEEDIRTGRYHKMLYPVSKNETKEMEHRLELAQNALVEPDAEFLDIHSEMQEIVRWSKNKQYYFQWKVVLAYCIALFILPLFLRNSVDIKKVRKDMADIRSWEMVDSYFTPEQTHEVKVFMEDAFKSAYNYKYRVLNVITERIEHERADVKYEKDPVKLKEAKKKLEEDLALYNEKNKMTTKEMQDWLLGEYQKEVDTFNSEETEHQVIIVLLCALLVVYLISCYQYGYNINRSLHFRQSMDRLFRIGGTVVAVGAAAGTAVTIIKWSNGTETREYDHNGKVIMLAGLTILLFCSGVILFFSSIDGFYYNYLKKEKPYIPQTPKFLFDENGYLLDTDVQKEPKKKGILRGIMNIMLHNLQGVFSPDGREGRLGYVIFTFLFSMVASSIVSRIYDNFMLTSVVMLTACMVLFSATSRRLHDFGVTSKFAAVMFVFPPILYVLMLILPLVPGTKGENEYGPEPESYFS